ncbi:c2H2-type domain-containing protein [Trichonephila clavipes]|uniref:C2H2-type domain-containing protein n=1 Tax=Trichonephila clavipes TaxID=2585209 RepID=A0A8X6VAP6_TRICX|nr:c2H2-type domain-containing protein [Trichonephila clavipes]
MIVINQDDKIIHHNYYAGTDAVEHFLNITKDLSFRLIAELKKVSENELDDSSMYDPSKCVICHKKFRPTDRIVRHHLHHENFVTGKAHQICNLQYRKKFYLPIFLHNGRSYDNHLLLKYLPKDFAKEINIIPINLEKISMFTLDHLKFLDSYQFLDSSLDTLIENLLISKHDFKIFDTFFRENKNKYLLYRKGIFPYSYTDNTDKLQTKGLPPREAFFNVLTRQHISEKDYMHALAVFRAFELKTFGNYLKLYQNTDVLMLAEVFCAFRNLSLRYYELDPVHYISISELTFDAGLKFCKIELQLFGNINDYIWLESQMRGGICLVSKRYARANNPSLSSIYDPSKPHSYILALDIANLYGYAMSQFLAYVCGDFYWLSLEEINNFDVLTIPQNNNKGFILEVDLEYPESEHDRLNDLPLAPEHLKITREMLSPYAERSCTKFRLQNTFPSKKLAPNFYPKTHYIVHYLTLQFHLKQGLKLTKIHRILMFSQKPWLREYIAFNNSKRLSCNTQSEKLFFKKLNNSFYGKCLQNVRKRVNVKGALTIEDCKKYLASPALDYFEPLNESLTLCKMKQTDLRLDKPIYIGFTVLEISKLRLYELYFSYFKKFYDSKCALLYTDTDSLYMNIETPNVYDDIQHNFTEIMDLSNFENSHPLLVKQTRVVLNFKNETCLPFEGICWFETQDV